MRRNRALRRAPASVRNPLTRTLPMPLMIAVLMGVARLRPVATIGMAAVAGVGVVSVAVLPSGENHASPLFSWSAQPSIEKRAVGNFPPPPQPIVPTEFRAPAEPGLRDAPFERVVRVENGDTLMNLVLREGVDHSEAHEAITALRDVYDPRSIRPGQAITLTLADSRNPDAKADLVGLQVTKGFDRYAGAARLSSGSFGPFEVQKKLNREPARAAGEIRASLFADAVSNGTPANVMAEYIRLFSYDVDFQRDIQPGDAYDVMYERFIERGGHVAHNGEITYAALTTNGQTRHFYRFERGDGTVGYFNEDGEGVRKPLLRTPIDGARISSGFGRRMHPILGYTRMHKGIDFAANTGTPIRAAGNGTLEYYARNGSFGRYARIRHNNTFKTAYAHMSKFAKGLKKGSRVTQGQVIGYVGTSGNSTGPHLHYEVLKNGTQVNPRKIEFPSDERLAGKDLLKFKLVREEVDRQLQKLPGRDLVAAQR